MTEGQNIASSSLSKGLLLSVKFYTSCRREPRERKERRWFSWPNDRHRFRNEMDAALLDRIVQVITAAHSGNASIDERRAEVGLFDELRNSSQIQVAIQVAVALTTGTHGHEVAGSGGNEYVSSQLTLLGYGVLQHVAGNRWDELSAGERDAMVGLCFSLLEGLCGGGAQQQQQQQQQQARSALMFALRSKCAVLFAIVIKRHGAAYASESIKRLVADEAKYVNVPHAKSAYQAIVSLVFKYLVDEVYQFAGDMGGVHARDMLVCMATWFPEILRFTVNALEDNFKVYGEAQDAYGKKNAMFAVKTALESGALYGEVAPAGAMYASGFIKAAGYFLSMPDSTSIQNPQDLADIKSSSCEILKCVGSRRKTSDENQEDFSRGMQEVGMFLTQVAGELLKNNPEERLSFEGEDEEFAFEVVDAMVELGRTHLQDALPDEAGRFAFLEHMLSFAKHSYMPLASRSLGLWYKLLQESASSVASGGQRSVLPSEAVLFLMQLAAKQLQQRNCKVPQLDDEVPIYFDDFEEFKEFITAYRQRLSGIVRYSAVALPDQALHTTVSRLTDAISQAKVATNSVSASAEAQSETMEAARGALEAAAVFSESTVKAVWDAVNAKALSDEAKMARKHAFCQVLEPIYSATILLRVGDAKLLLSQAKALSSLARLITLRPDLAKDAYSNIQDMLVNCIPLNPGEHEVPPPLPSEPWREGSQARVAVATVFLDYAIMCQEGFLSLLEEIAGNVSQLYEAGRIRPGERNLLMDGILASAVTGSPQLQETVIDWSLQMTKASWASASVQQAISDPESFVKTYLPTRMEGSDVRVGGAKERYRMNHELHHIERTMRRMATDCSRQVLTKHMMWIVPHSLQVLLCISALTTARGRELLGPAVGILDLSQQEKALYLRRVGVRLAPVPGDANAGDYSSVGGETVSSARGWLRHCMEYVAHFLGLLTSVVPACLSTIPKLNEAGSLIYSHVESMDHRILRIFVRHLTIPAVRDCPAEHMAAWVLPSLSILAPHMKVRLATAWQSLNPAALGQDGFPQVSAHGQFSAHGAPQVNDEDVINDRLVRELSGEYADLLKAVADRQSQVPLLQNFFVADPQGGLALAHAALEGMLRPDESAYRFAFFCKALVQLAPSDAALYQFVGSELLYTAISSLSLEVMACRHSEVLAMIRDIVMQQVDDPQSQVHKVLPMLPGVGPENLAAFFTAMKSTRSDKEQRNQVKLFLLSSGGTGAFTALEKWKPPGGASTVQGVKKRPARVPKSQAEAEADDHLSGEITRHLLSST